MTLYLVTSHDVTLSFMKMSSWLLDTPETDSVSNLMTWVTLGVIQSPAQSPDSNQTNSFSRNFANVYIIKLGTGVNFMCTPPGEISPDHRKSNDELTTVSSFLTSSTALSSLRVALFSVSSTVISTWSSSLRCSQLGLPLFCSSWNIGLTLAMDNEWGGQFSIHGRGSTEHLRGE